MIDNSTLYSCTLIPSPNSSYLYNIHSPVLQDPFSGSTMGLMMILSAFQYQPSGISQNYSNALNNASKAAFIQSGGQSMEDQFVSKTTVMFADTAHSMGLTDSEMGIVFGSAKIFKYKQMDLNGPKFYSIKTHLTINQNSGSLGLKYEW